MLYNKKLKKLKELACILKRLKKGHKKIVFTNGCFDLLHAGHINYLARAKSLGNILIVGLNSDASLKKLKGKKRPVIKETNRAYVLSGLESVDFIVIFKELTPLGLIKTIKPDVLVKGGDWNKENIVGGSFVKSYGGKVKSLGFVKGLSTKKIIGKIKSI